MSDLPEQNLSPLLLVTKKLEEPSPAEHGGSKESNVSLCMHKWMEGGQQLICWKHTLQKYPLYVIINAAISTISQWLWG